MKMELTTAAPIVTAILGLECADMSALSNRRHVAAQKNQFAFLQSSVTFTLPLDDRSLEGNGLNSVPAWGWAATITLNLIPCSAGWFASDDGSGY
ncbi:MAG TPA: hypothetical protein VMR33_04380 [Candidatus Baltobacteraceae bacterium]|jgi:hypothetical protein|nr:hypothetical protein [Candidatus Baltobacteraceae bacterium]